jgi:hypothetical protein
MAEKGRIVYVCSECFRVAGGQEICHGRPMLECDAGLPGDERSKPVMTPEGELVTHAPRWWVEMCLEIQQRKR